MDKKDVKDFSLKNKKEMLNKAEKKAIYLAGIFSWRKKNSEWLLTTEEADSIFIRE